MEAMRGWMDDGSRKAKDDEGGQEGGRESARAQTCRQPARRWAQALSQTNAREPAQSKSQRPPNSNAAAAFTHRRRPLFISQQTR